MALAVSGWFAVHRLPVRKQDALCCPDFPRGTFANTSRQGRLFVAKIDFIFKQYRNDNVAKLRFEKITRILGRAMRYSPHPNMLLGCRF